MCSKIAPLTLDAAQSLLRQFTASDRLPSNPSLDIVAVREAVLLVREHSDYQIFGICADSTEQAIAALHAYLHALGYAQVPQPASPIEGAVYLKFNPKSELCYLDAYTGDYRGVLVSCQSAYEGDINEMFGHLPLALWD
jgi:Domain of unknown function (DUF1824)